VKSGPTNLGGNTWRFGVSNLQNGTLNVSLAAEAGDIEDAAGNDLAAANWSYTVSIVTANQPPVLAAIGDRTISSATQNGVVSLSASDPNSDPLTYSATAQSIEYHLDQALGLGSAGGNEYLNWGGRNEKWLTSAGGWHYILPDGKLYRSVSGDMNSDPLVEQLSLADYANTALLHSATANNAPAVLSTSGSTLTINPHDTFSGRFVVTATVSDGRGGSDSETFFVTVESGGGTGANQPPVLAAIGDRTISSATQNGVVSLSASDPNSDPLTYSATAQSIEYHLDQALGLGSAGGNEYLNWGGRNEKWLTSAGGWHYILPDGRLYRSVSGDMNSDPLVEQLSPADYANTALLHSAAANNAPAVLSTSGSTLTINPHDTFSGRFVVTATVSDGRGGSDSETFFVSVL
jgi:hypothetical protein